MSASLKSEEPSIKDQILAAIPLQKPFCFVDRIIEVDAERISGQFTFDPSLSFYEGHFPGKPVTPGVILLECMSQIALTAHALYLFYLEDGRVNPKRLISPVFSGVTADFVNQVLPGDIVTVKAEKQLWEEGRLTSKVELLVGENKTAAQATLVGSELK